MCKPHKVGRGVHGLGCRGVELTGRRKGVIEIVYGRNNFGLQGEGCRLQDLQSRAM